MHSSSFKSLKTEDMRLKLEKGLQLFFQKFWSKLPLICFLYFLFCSFPSHTQIFFFVALQFAHPMIQKLLNLVKEWEKYWKVLCIVTCSVMGNSIYTYSQALCAKLSNSHYYLIIFAKLTFWPCLYLDKGHIVNILLFKGCLIGLCVGKMLWAMKFLDWIVFSTILSEQT